MSPRSAPINRSRRPDRIKSWNDDAASGAKYRPAALSGQGAMFEWVRALQGSDLPSTTRLVGISLALNGNADGSNIYPGVRRLAAQTNLSQRAVGEHISYLVGRGFLVRKARGGDTAGAKGFEYLLRKPAVLIGDKHWGPVLIHRQHSADAHAASADRDSSSVLTARQPTTVLPPKDQGARPRNVEAGRARRRSHESQ